MFNSEVKCSTNPDIFFSELKANVAEAKRLCSLCPSFHRCLEETLAYEELAGERKEGIYAGLTPQERGVLAYRRRKHAVQQR